LAIRKLKRFYESPAVKVLIKLGGALLDDAAKRTSMARQLADVAKKVELVVVHGGGKQVTQFLAERGIESRFVNGLRVSDAAVIDAVSKVIAGSVNKQLVAAIATAGQPAVGLSGVDGALTTAAPLQAELQFVGRPQRTDATLFRLLLGAGYLPVVACIAGDASGNIYNVNADQMAVSCALGWEADKLFFLTDVAGVKDEGGRVLPALTASAARRLVATGVANGGMQAKLEAALSSLDGGLTEVIVAPGQHAGVCHRLLDGENVGTRLALEAV
jgi:acetylglutamate kinase